MTQTDNTMKRVTRSEYFAHFMHRDSVLCFTDKGVAEWTLRNSRTVIAKRVEIAYDTYEYYIN